MGKWSADFANDPFDDYSLIVEILHDEEDVAVIKKGEEGLEIKWYPTEKELIVPFDWLMGLFLEAKIRLSDNQ